MREVGCLLPVQRQEGSNIEKTGGQGWEDLPTPTDVPKGSSGLAYAPLLRQWWDVRQTAFRINWGYRGQKTLPGSGKGMQGVDRQEARMWESPKVVTEGERQPKRKWQRTWTRSRCFLHAAQSVSRFTSVNWVWSTATEHCCLWHGDPSAAHTDHPVLCAQVHRASSFSAGLNFKQKLRPLKK